MLDKEKPSIRKHSDIVQENKGKATAIALFVAILLTFTLPSNIDGHTVLDNTTSLEFIEDNRLGSLYIERDSPLPTHYTAPQFKACIYTAQNSSPVILPVQSQETFFFTRQNIKTTDLEVSIPKEDLSTEGISQELEIHKQERCPLRSKPQIVIAEMKTN